MRTLVAIPVYNEEEVLPAKLENALALDYPKDRLEIVVASDGSTDRTVAIAREFAPQGVVVHEYRTNRGKNAALNDTVPAARGDIIVFQDPNDAEVLLLVVDGEPEDVPVVPHCCGNVIHRQLRQCLAEVSHRTLRLCSLRSVIRKSGSCSSSCA